MSVTVVAVDPVAVNNEPYCDLVNTFSERTFSFKKSDGEDEGLGRTSKLLGLEINNRLDPFNSVGRGLRQSP